ncbi:MAG: hypothetical protein JXQ75_14655 [Phycisphaerae bacterium]|nr:hypothetical protein [Phycisphaerae bacterium]
MNAPDDKPTGVDERIERLICRCLDGEADAEERAELAGALARDQAARALFDEYERIDKLAAEALRYDLGLAKSSAASRGYHRWRIGVAGAVLTAAAVIAMSFLPRFWSTGSPVMPGNHVAQDAGTRPRVVAPIAPPVVAPRMAGYSPSIDYTDMDHRPFERLRDVRRDLIGIQGDKKNRIYIFERDRCSTRLVPVSGDI